MKPLSTSLIAGALVALAGTAMASSGSLVNFKPEVMPVVVQVNARGQVIDILPAVQLSQAYRQLLIKQLDVWITRPAEIKGEPVDSRFIIEVAMQAKPRKDGKYDASFVYVKSMPLAYGGALHWNVINGGLEYALVSDALGPGANTLAEMMTFQTLRKPFVPSEWRSTSDNAAAPRPMSHAVHPTPPPVSLPVANLNSSPLAPSTPRTQRP